MIRGVIFDLGSTLLHTNLDGQFEALFARMDDDLLASLQAQGYALEGAKFIQRFTANYEANDHQRRTDWKEITTGRVLEATLAELGAPPPAPSVLAEALRAYYAYSESLWGPMPGLYETLAQLQAAGYQLAIISNAGDDANVQRLIDAARLRPYFHPIIVSSAVGIRKPDPKIFDLVLEPWNLPAAECVMVGDTLDADILGAQKRGLHNVWITAHAGRPANLAQRNDIIPEVEIATLPELPAVLASL